MSTLDETYPGWRQAFGRTLAILIAVGLFAIAWDIDLSRSEDAPAWIGTISAVMRYVGNVAPVVVVGFSMLVPHFWINFGSIAREWGIDTEWDGQLVRSPYNIYVMVGIGILWLVGGLVWLFVFGAPYRATVTLVALVIGLLTGALLWPQRGHEYDPRLK